MDHPNPSPGEEWRGEADTREEVYEDSRRKGEGESSRRSQQERANTTISLSLAKRPERLGAAKLVTLDGFAWKTRIYSHACQIEIFGIPSPLLRQRASPNTSRTQTSSASSRPGKQSNRKPPGLEGNRWLRAISYWYGSTDGCASVLEQEDETGSRNLNPGEEGGRRKVCATWDVVGDFVTLSCRVTAWMAALRCTTSPSADRPYRLPGRSATCR